MPALHDPLTLAGALGVLLGLALALVVAGLLPRTVRLGDALGVLDAGATDATPDADGHDTAGGALGWDERLGRFGYTRLRVPVSTEMQRRLELRARTPADFVAEKLVLALAGLALPQLYLALRLLLGGHLTMVPVGWSLLLGTVGFFWPDVALRREHAGTRDDARQQVLSFFDLVTLERLANQSAIASLQTASEMSDTLVFRRVRAALARARLEQRPPWADLQRVSDDLDLPEIADLVDVLRLDEQGAALADALRARVKELRDAHLTREKVAAQAVSESMTLWMVIPSFMTGVLLIAPPLLRMTGLG